MNGVPGRTQVADRITIDLATRPTARKFTGCVIRCMPASFISTRKTATLA